MKTRTKILCLVLLLFICATGIFASCDTQDKEKEYTEQAKKQSLAIVGLPDITNFFEMAQLKEIYEMRDDPNLVMYWYSESEMSGKFVYEGMCVGYGIPYGASITNPEQYYKWGETLPLAEPNGLYTNTVTSSATWVLAIDEEGNISPEYVEPNVRITQRKIDKRLVEEWSLTPDY